jgi:RNA polymerase sigma-70 factor (ECF subfamily)
LHERGGLCGYDLLAATRADMLRRPLRWEPAARAHEDALGMASREADKRFLRKRLAEAARLLESASTTK